LQHDDFYRWRLSALQRKRGKLMAIKVVMKAGGVERSVLLNNETG
jgi:hypothetical protein